MIKQIIIISIVFTFLCKSALTQCPGGNNIFLGTTNTDWNVAANWSEGCVPQSPITGFISIESNCVLGGTASYTFSTGSTFQIKADVTFTNNSSGNWIMNGNSTGSGTYIGHQTISGPLKPGFVGQGTSGTITYGSQTYGTKLMPDGKWWMTENLNIGSQVSGLNNMINNGIIEKYCYDNLESNCITYGALYQWDEAMQYTTIQGSQGICPTGWHIPTDGEWTALKNAIPTPDIGSRLASNAALWNDGILEQSPHFSTTGFNAIPGGTRSHINGVFVGNGDLSYFWSSTETGTNNLSWIRFINYNNYNLITVGENKGTGHPVRCVQN